MRGPYQEIGWARLPALYYVHSCSSLGRAVTAGPRRHAERGMGWALGLEERPCLFLGTADPSGLSRPLFSLRCLCVGCGGGGPPCEARHQEESDPIILYSETPYFLCHRIDRRTD